MLSKFTAVLSYGFIQSVDDDFNNNNNKIELNHKNN